MDINQTLLEYGKLKIKDKELSKEISRLFEYQADHEEGQLSEFFNYYKDFMKNERRFTGNGYTEPDSIEDWAEDWGAAFASDRKLTEVTETSYKILDLIKERKAVRNDIRAKKIAITKYAFKLVKEENNE